MFLPGRGARPLGRAGSFVAGADDAGALYYNPAGLADVDDVTALLDGGLIFQRVHYDRVDSGGNPQPPVDGQMQILPIPTVALTWQPRRWVTLAAGLWVPYLALNDYPEDGPQRYSLVTLDGSAGAVLELAAAFKLNEHVWLGLGLQNLIFHFNSRITLSGCLETNCAPEDPGFDALTEANATSWFTPSGIVGLTVAYPTWRAGASLQLPFWVSADGTVRPRLPTDPMYANVTVNGDSASVELTLPLMLRAGFEVRPIPKLRLELGFDYEAWSMQKSITLRPHGVHLDNVPGIGTYYLGPTAIPLGRTDSFSAHLGIEWTPPFTGVLRRKLDLRAGYLFESSSTPDAYVSVLNPDGMKNMITAGFSTHIWKLRFDVGYAHIFMPDRTVTDSQALQANPVRPSLAVPVGNGHYSIVTDILAAGVNGVF